MRSEKMKVKNIISVALVTTGLIAGSISVTHADQTPLPAATNSAAYKAALEKYQIDILKYRIAVTKNAITYRVAMEKYNADWAIVLAKYEAGWKATWDQYLALHSAYNAKIVPIAAVRKAATDKADADFLAAIAVAGATNAQLDVALKAHNAAIEAAGIAFKSAVAALGPEPVKPTKPAELNKPAEPVKPVSPVKPVEPGKPSKDEKHK